MTGPPALLNKLFLILNCIIGNVANTLYRIIVKDITWNVSEKLDRNLSLSIYGMLANRSANK